eukprot:gene23131-9471_t
MMGADSFFPAFIPKTPDTFLTLLVDTLRELEKNGSVNTGN